MKVAMNAVSAKMGGALAYLRNFLATLRRTETADEFVVFVQSQWAGELRGLAGNIQIETSASAEGGPGRRVLFDQWELRRFLKRWRADCLFSTANFGVLWPPAPQVTNVRNPVYFSRDYYRHVADVEGRTAAWKVAARRRMVALSCASSEVVVTPTQAMREMLLEWKAADPGKCVVINHGFDRESFLSMDKTDGALEAALERRRGEAILFYPSLYGKHKNFDTLIEGLGELALRGTNARLFLTCTIEPEADAYQRRTAGIVERHGLAERITLHGPVPYGYMPRIYRAADVVVWPSFAESFGHPLLEAMACERPIVASGIASNREMARDAALYFDTFNAEDFADKVEEALDESTAKRLVASGARRVGDFSWRRYVGEFLAVFRKLAEGKNG